MEIILFGYFSSVFFRVLPWQDVLLRLPRRSMETRDGGSNLINRNIGNVPAVTLHPACLWMPGVVALRVAGTKDFLPP